MTTNNDEKQLVDKSLRETSDKRMYERYLAVLHRLKGHTIKDISKMIKRTEKTTAGYIHRYGRDGIEDLALGHSPGKPRRLTHEQETILADTIATKRPDDEGIEAKYTWTLKLAMLFVDRELGDTKKRNVRPAASARIQSYQSNLYHGTSRF